MKKNCVVSNITFAFYVVSLVIYMSVMVVFMFNFVADDCHSDCIVTAYAEEVQNEDSNNENKSNVENSSQDSADLRGWISIIVSIFALSMTVLNGVITIRKCKKDNRKELKNNKRAVLMHLEKFKEELSRTVDPSNTIECRNDKDFPYCEICDIINESKYFAKISAPYEDFCNLVDRYFIGAVEEKKVLESYEKLCAVVRNIGNNNKMKKGGGK